MSGSGKRRSEVEEEYSVRGDKIFGNRTFHGSHD